jgi:hypothetical protein
MPENVEVDVSATAARVAAALEHANIPYAIGGALALTMHGYVRATHDVDLNVFCEPEGLPRVLTVLERLGLKFDARQAAREAETEGWFTAWDGAVAVDLFVPSIDFSWEALRSRVNLDFLGAPAWFLSAEALCVFKLLFFRTKDLADLEQLVLASKAINHAAVRATISQLMGEDDPRCRAWDDVVARFGNKG